MISTKVSCNLCNGRKEAFPVSQTLVVCNYQLSYEATRWERGTI